MGKNNLADVDELVERPNLHPAVLLPIAFAFRTPQKRMLVWHQASAAKLSNAPSRDGNAPLLVLQNVGGRRLLETSVPA